MMMLLLKTNGGILLQRKRPGLVTSYMQQSDGAKSGGKGITSIINVPSVRHTAQPSVGCSESQCNYVSTVESSDENEWLCKDRKDPLYEQHLIYIDIKVYVMICCVMLCYVML